MEHAFPKEQEGNTQELQKQRFQAYFMAQLTEHFAQDLERLRKEESMEADRVALLADSLEAGAELYEDEMALVE
jgi:hypothetical protein